MSEIVESERHGAVAVLRLNRPEALNALSDALLEALCAAFDAAEQDPGVRCAVLRGAGRAIGAPAGRGCARRSFRSSQPCTAGAWAAAASSR